MPLINFSKEELSKIEYYLLGETDPIVVSILEKIEALSDVCECNSFHFSTSKESINATQCSVNFFTSIGATLSSSSPI